MAAKHLKFLVVFFTKNKRLFMTVGALAILVALVGAIGAFAGWLGPKQKGQALNYTVLVEEPDWHGVPAEASLPRYFVAGGTAFDRQILVEGWGLPEQVLKSVDYMQDIGLHILMGQVTQVLYTGDRLEVYIEEKSSGYQLVTVSKADMAEGDLQIIFFNGAGARIGYEEEFVYSVPLSFTLLDSGVIDSKGAAFIEILDTETLPVLTDYSPDFLSRNSGSLLLYVQGAKVATIQRNETTLRIYTKPDPGFYVVAVDTKSLHSGQNILRLIDSESLQVLHELVYLVIE